MHYVRPAFLTLVALVAVALPVQGAPAGKASPAVQSAADACFGKTKVAWPKLVMACTTMIGTNVRPELKAAAYFNRGAANVKLGKGDKALPDFNAALDIMPDFARALEARGVLLFAQGKTDAGLKDLDRAIELDPKSGVALNNRAMVRLEKGDRAGALADFDRVLALDAKDGVALVNRGVVLAATGETARARADFEAALAVDPQNEQARRQLAALKMDGGAK
jgi:tetratricopeptide (TPR) repeat protein